MTFIDRSSTRLARFGWAATLLITGLVAGCGDEVVECFDDKTCGLNMRCNRAKIGDPGTCEACGSQEISYDGVDNDCSPRTPDFDLDGDGDNWVNAPSRKGTDCNDEDPTVKPGLPELCNDQKDNDCDMKVDEKDCGDRAPPTVNILMPANNQLITGAFSLVVDATDDVGLTTMAINVDGVQFMTRTLGEVVSTSATIEVNSMIINEGLVELQVIVTDVAGGTATDMIVINVDNRSGPAINLLRPREARAYGGTMNIEAEIADPSGVASVEMFLDSTPIRSITASVTAGTFEHSIDTRTLSEGPHLFRIQSTEGRAQGPVTTTLDVNFTVDNTPPVVQIIAPIDGARVTGLIRPRVEATDQSGILQISLEGNNGPTPLEFNLDTTSLPNGNRTLSAVAIDNAEVSGSTGNSATDAVTIRIENANGGPVVNVRAPVDGGRVIGRTLVQVDATSQGANILQVSARMGGELVGWAGSLPFSFYVDFGRTPGPAQLAVEALDSMGRSGVALIDVTVGDPVVLELPTCVSAGEIGLSGFGISDLNNDGVLDIVAAGESGTIVEGRISPDGRWGVLRIVPLTLNLSRRAVVTDIDGDGTKDIVVQYARDVEVHTYVPGNRTLIMIDDVAAGDGDAMDLGDVDGDGDLDLVVDAIAAPAQVFLWSNGGFQPGQTLVGMGGTQDIRVIDVENDGDLDIVLVQTPLAAQPATALGFLNDGTGQFGAARQTIAAESLEALELADVTQDGIPDLIAAGGSGWVFPGLAATPGTFGPATEYETESAGTSVSVAVADIDEDGRLDWVFAGTQAAGAQVWLNPVGLPAYRSGAYSLGENIKHIQTADMNGDGNLDLVSSSPPDHDVCIAFGLGAGEFYAPSVRGQPNLFALGVGDVAGSTAPDLVLATNAGILVQESLAGSGFSPQPAVPFIHNATAVEVGDFDGIGSLDIAVAHVDGIDLLTSLGGGSYTTTDLLLGQNPRGLASGDVDRDGVVELVGALSAGMNSGAIIIEVPTGATQTRVAAGSGGRSVVIGNLDSDPGGTLDIGVVNGLSSNFALSTYNTGTGAWTTTLFGLPANPTSAATADFNIDGRADLAIAHASGVAIYMGDAALGFAAPIDVDLGVNILGIGSADVNRDGRPDIVVGTSVTRSFLIVSDPGGTFYPPIKISTLLNGFDAKAGDFDGNGYPDLVLGHKFPTAAWTLISANEY